MPLTTDDELRDLLGRIRSIAVVGIKAGGGDDAYKVPRYMQLRGYTIRPVSPRLEQVLGEPCVPTLGHLWETPDLVNLFRAPTHLPAHAEEILTLPAYPLGVWMQRGIRHAEAAARLEAAGIAVVEDRCLMVEHARLLSGGVS